LTENLVRMNPEPHPLLNRRLPVQNPLGSIFCYFECGVMLGQVIERILRRAYESSYATNLR